MRFYQRVTGIVIALMTSLVGGLGPMAVTSARAASTAEVNVRDFGATVDDTTDDTAAIQKANNAVAATGGRVYFPPGTYIAGGVVQDSGVEFYGTLDAILKHPNGVSPSSIVKSRRFSTSGSIVRGSRTVRLASIAHLRPGSMVAIRGAGETIQGQTTSFPFLYAVVESISGNDALLTRPALLSVTSAAVWIGSSNLAIRGLTLDGNKPSGQAPDAFTAAIEYVLARGAVVSGCVIRNGLYGGIKLDLGTSGSTIENNVLTANGVPAARLGAAVWMFRGSSYNVVRNNVINGSSYIGITMDDRTQSATDWDGPTNNNLVEGNQINYTPVDWNVAIFVIGGNANVVRNNILKSVQSGIAVEKSGQGKNPRDAQRNIVSGNSMSNHGYGIRVTGSYNTFSSNTITSTKTPIQNRGSQNTFS
jgi:parallel beta-helix repeat protein